MKIKTNNTFARLSLVGAVCLLLAPPNGQAQTCPGLGSVNLNVVIVPNPTLNAPTQICTGGTGTITVTQFFPSYAWSTGGAGQSISINTPGTYTVTVTNASGCSVTASTDVDAAPDATPFITQNPYACNGTVSLNAGAFNSYAWSNGGGNGQTANYASSGTYTVTVTNAAGCTGTDNFTVSIPTPPVTTISGALTFCSGLSTTLDATPGFAAYSWTGGDHSSSLEVFTSGIYTVTVTDDFGCTDTESATVLTNSSPSPLVDDESVCIGSSVNLKVNNAPFQSYNWSNGSTTSSTTANGPGNFSVTVTAANGCTGTADAVVSTFPEPSPFIDQIPYSCNGQVTLAVDPVFSSYQWSNGGTTTTITVTTPANYEITVTNGFGCTGTNEFTVNIPAPPLVNIAGNNTFCPGGSSTLTATGGFNQYIWSTNATDPDISVSSAGNYTVTVTDGFGCTATDEFGVNQLAAPNPNISGPAQICAPGNATFSVPGNYTAYLWSTGDNTPTITVNAANTYSVTVTAPNGCTGTDAQNLLVSNSLLPQIQEAPYTCNGQITLDAGAGFNTYLWDGGATTQSITINANGSYQVSVSDANGCTGTAVINSSIPSPPSVSISGNNNICIGASTTLVASPGLSNYTWSGGQIGDSIVVSTPGAYTVTATDALGCTVSSSFQLQNNPAPQPDITGPTVLCTSSSGTLSLGTAFNQYLWNTGETTGSIAIDSAATYVVTVTDALGCTGTDTQAVTQVTALSPMVLALPYTCNGIQTLDAGTGFSTYLWSGGENTSSINVSSAGTYSVTVTDASGCTGTGTLQIAIPALPQVSIAGPLSFCQNNNVMLVAGTGFAAYQWSTGETASSINTGLGGVISVTVTDNLGCTDSESVTVTAQPLPQPQITGTTVVCVGNSATLTLTQTYTAYTWDNGSISAGIVTDTAGTFTVTVTDGNGCTGVANAAVTVHPNPITGIVEESYTCNGQITLTASPGFNLYSWAGPNGFSSSNPQAAASQSGTYTVTVTDQNGCTGSAVQNTNVPALTQVAISGPAQVCTGAIGNLTAASGFVQYAWSDGSNSLNLSTSTAGAYTVTATDALGCTSTASFVLGNFPTPTPVIAGPQTVCPGNSVALSVNGNFAQFLWSTGETTSSINAPAPLTASVTVTDANGCTGTASASVTVSNQLSPGIAVQPYACDGQITLDAGTGFPIYTWSNAATSALITVSQSGTYTVTVSDGNGCSGTATTQVSVPGLPSVSISGPSTICAGQSTALTASSGLVSYQWSNGDNNPVITVSQANTYTVTATDGNGCTATSTFTLGLSPALTPQVDGNNTICPGNSAIFTVSGNFANYHWSNGENTASITVSLPTNYTVTVTDANGCTGTASIDLNLNPAPTPAITGANLLCPGSSVPLNTNTGFSSYSWSTGSNLAAISVQTAGSYTVTVTNASGCSATASAQVSAAPAASVTIAGGGLICNGSSTTLTGAGSTGNYIWSTGNTGNAIIVSQSGTYTVTVTDANTCTATDMQTVAIAPAILTTLSNSSCRIQDAGSQSFTWSATNGCDSVVTIVTTYQPSLPGMALEMIPEITAEQGELITLNVAGNFPIDSVLFESPFTLSCSNCLDPSLVATTAGFIQVTAFDTAGCRSSEEIRILVNKALGIYVPNAFQPGSAQNGYFSVFSAASVTSVRNFNVFDRWGNGLFSRADLPTNNPEAGWDGSFRGQPMQPGVYVYYFEVLRANGSVEVFSGNVTLVE